MRACCAVHPADDIAASLVEPALKSRCQAPSLFPDNDLHIIDLERIAVSQFRTGDDPQFTASGLGVAEHHGSGGGEVEAAIWELVQRHMLADSF